MGSADSASLVVELSADSTVGDALEAADIVRGVAAVVSVNGVIASMDRRVRSGDAVQVIKSAPGIDAPIPPELLPRPFLIRLLEGILRFGRKGFARVAEFTPSRLNFSWINEQLAIGGAFRTADIRSLDGLGITAVVDCREEASDDEAELARHGIKFLRLPTPDAHELSQESLDTGVDWIRDRLDEGDKVYVHCFHGVGRAPLLGSCVLVSQGESAPEALKIVKSRRWQASPNEEQLGALLKFWQRHRGEQPTAEASVS